MHITPEEQPLAPQPGFAHRGKFTTSFSSALQRLRQPFALSGILACTLLLVSSSIGLAAEPLPARTALDDYVEKPDDSFSWKVVEHDKTKGMQTFVLDMVSQNWRTKADVDRTEWQHWVTVAVPDEIKSNVGFMWIGGGRNGGDPPKGPSERVIQIAKATQTVVAEVHMIPNQTLVFHKDGKRRVEDDLIAYTWVKFLETGDATWPARNPMVKSVVRAMDAVTELLASDEGGKRKVDEYFVAGGSKRGWTTWLVGAVDKRVVGIAPIVIDILNLEKSMNHHFSCYGFFSPSVGDYVAHKLMRMGDHPRIAALHGLVDPYSYRHRLTMPKYVINGAGDQYFPPDLSRYYFDDLIGEKYLRYVPNTDHSLRGTDAVESLIAFYLTVLAKEEGPKFSWKQTAENTIEIKTVDKPEKVLLWQATNPKGRDFRIESVGPIYTSTELKDQGDGVYVAHVETPKEGWTAFFAELTYDVGMPVPLKVTTNVGITPDTFPFADKDQTLPTSLTLKFIAPNQQAIDTIKKAMSSPQMKAVGDDPRLKVDEKTDKGLVVTFNWVPKGEWDDGARSIADYLKNLGCDDFQYQLESGRPFGDKKSE
ncbi:PhoPQ-activated pathogenicity-related protein [Symmachiella dynata]|uniref:PhoPQ-activated pathogenicity-related protein n=1 Tax=Symmachiella dynata TaxID=2527995 RepID=A0A517ZT19_9PLAN|nr:PhoPQ-activated pathogenicity-related family protein [Symmachiella dynata]QDU45637.1 PhoPQ-activated pathogenicity-related protein [Symmachiella dynata]